MRITESRLRRFIRSVILENLTLDKLANVNFDTFDKDMYEDGIHELASSICSLVESIEDEEIYVNEYLENLNLNIGNLEQLIASESKVSFASSMMGIYTINKKVFDALGFTKSDIDKILSRNADHNEYTSSYDDNKSGASLSMGADGEEITISTNY
jgi:hypothetical protein